MKTGLTLITMGSGNVKVLKQTLESFKHICDEVIYGDLLLFEEDRKILNSYKEEYNMFIWELPFDYLFKYGFSSLLNKLSGFAKNDFVLYMNTSEVIGEDYGIVETVSKNRNECNTFYFTHLTDPHRWYRLYNKTELHWSGRIHEQLEGEYKPYHKPIFQMKDLEKDLDNPFKATVFNSVKEIVYFKNYMSLIDSPETIGATDPGWIKFAADNYESMKQRLEAKGKQYQAFIDFNLPAYMNEVMTNPEFEKERFESNIGIEYQGDKKYLL